MCMPWEKFAYFFGGAALIIVVALLIHFYRAKLERRFRFLRPQNNNEPSVRYQRYPENQPERTPQVYVNPGFDHGEGTSKTSSSTSKTGTPSSDGYLASSSGSSSQKSKSYQKKVPTEEDYWDYSTAPTSSMCFYSNHPKFLEFLDEIKAHPHQWIAIICGNPSTCSSLRFDANIVFNHDKCRQVAELEYLSQLHCTFASEDGSKSISYSPIHLQAADLRYADTTEFLKWSHTDMLNRTTSQPITASR